MHTQHSFVALVPPRDRRPSRTESTSTTNSNEFHRIHLARALISLAFACLVALAAGCATLSGGAPIAASPADEAPSGHWQRREPSLAADVTTSERLDATTAAADPTPTDDEDWLSGPDDQDALYYLRGSSRPMPEQRWHSSDGSAVREAYPSTAGYGTPGS